jgi:subtilase family serine protease
VSLNRATAALTLLCLVACAGTNSATPGLTPAAPGARTMRPMAAASPGEGAGALPGEGASALPGAQVPCSFSTTAGQASCTIAINVNVPAMSNPNAPAASIPGLSPSSLRALYGLPSANPGMRVAVVDAYDDPTAESDLAVYRSTYGMPACSSQNGCFQKVNQTGGTAYPPIDSAWSQEVALDLEMVSAACPNCTLLLVEANSASIDDLGASVDKAVALGAKVVSNSYYAGEWSGESAEDVHYRHPGVAMTVSAGDAASPFYPAASPYVTSVGGTSVNASGSETPWAYGGRGCSAYEPRPYFQNGVACSKRSTVDVAAVADPQTGVAVFSTESGGWVVAGGTSVGAPLVAAAYALTGRPQSTAYAYAHPAAFHDIAPAGYDLATGLGSPNGVAGL